MGPSERIQAISIARQYYLDRLSKIEIANLHGLSRYKIARILENCEAEGIVKIEIDTGKIVNAEVSERFRRFFGLKNAIVIAGAFEDTPTLRSALGRAAADLLAETLREEDVLGIAWGRTIDQMAQASKNLPSCTVVQMTGVAGSVQANSINLVHRISSITQGSTHPIYAPLIVSDRDALLAIQRQPEIQIAMDIWSKITLAIVAIGSWSDEGSQLYGFLTKQDRDAFSQLDMAFEICAIPMDKNGAIIKTPLTERTVGIPYETLKKIPDVIAVAGGVTKIDAIRAALKSKLISSIVTDEIVARKLLGD